MSCFRFQAIIAFARLLAVLLLATDVLAADAPSGEQIFKRQCASCHGARGEGIKDKYSQPLIGERSLGELTQYVEKTMPEDAPGTCVGEDARKVSAFMYESFYSPTAQARNSPARIELSRLTVKQYRQTVADLMGSFRGSGQWGEQRGLKGEYFKSRNFQKNDKALERVDATINFDWDTSSPEPEKLDPHQFSIRWEGSISVPETGNFEFVVKTEHATRLWINDLNQPLVDAWVMSGKETEFRQSLFLLAGRAYPLKLDLSKAKQGVDDTKKEKERPPLKASMVLAWKRPQLAEEPIPSRFLSTSRFPESLIVNTPFPPDDRSIGYERGTSISKAWDEATTEAALMVSAEVLKRLNELAGTKSDAGDRAVKVRDFARRFVERAFRRPLSDEQQSVYVDQQFERTADLESAMKRIVLLTLKSPRFLYRELGDANDAHAVASRLSFALLDSQPDQQLSEAATKGKLTTRDQVASQAERLLADPRAQAKLHDFFLQWLKVSPAPDVSKDPSRFPEFTAAVVTDLRNSLELSVDEVLRSDAADFRQLLVSDSISLNGRLAKFYGVDMPAESGFEKVVLDPGHRAGVLSHPYLMASFAYTGTSSPIHRGVFLSRSVLGRSLRVPPEAVSPLAPDLHPSLTTRERIALQTNATACQTCHSMINPLGFTLEHFDAVGRFRGEEQGKPIDAGGSYRTPKGNVVKFTGVRELATYLASSDEVHRAIVEQLFQHLIKQPILAYGIETPQTLRHEFAKREFSLKRLAVDIATTAALTALSEGQPSLSKKD